MPRPWNRNTLASIYELESNEARRIGTMEGARGFAVALVFLVHYRAALLAWADAEPVTSAIAGFFWTIGHSGVDLFFVLSGYLIYGAAIKPSLHYGRFMKRRAQRIYPTFLVMVAVYLVLSFVVPSQSKLPAETGAAAIYVVQNLLLLPGIFPIEPLIAVAWSLSYEFFFYLTLPVIVLAFRLQHWRPTARIGFWLAVAALYVTSWFVFTPQASRMLMFIAGILVYEGVHSYRERYSTSPPKEWAAMALMAVAFVLFPFLEPLRDGALYRTLLSAFAFGIFVFVLFRSEGPLRRAFNWTPMRWLGNMSYSYYLIHALVINGAAMVLLAVIPASAPKVLLFWTLMPLVFLATFVVSTFLFALVERPFSLATPKKKPEPLPATAEAVAP